MTLEDLVAAIPELQTWTLAEQVRIFAWYLQRQRGMSHFQPSDIAACFSTLHMTPPSSVSPFLQNMLKRKPPQALKTTNGYSLERKLRDTYDKKFGERETTVAVQKMLADLPAKIPGIDERAYLDEALKCFKAGAFRAAIIMAWNVTYDHFLYWVLNDPKRLGAMSVQLPKSYPKARVSAFASFDDFTHLKEDEVLTIAKSAGVIGLPLHKVMKRGLDRRNDSAHPSGNVVNQTNAEDSISDLIQNVVLKLN